MSAPAGWYPTSEGGLRYWDGTGWWTSDVAPAPGQGTEPVQPNPAAAATQLVFRFVDGDAEEPTAEIAAIEPRNGPERREKCLLSGIFRCATVTHEPKTEVIHSGLMPLDQPVEGVEVAVL